MSVVTSDTFIEEYFRASRTLTELFLASHVFTPHLSGLGVDGIPVCFSLGTSLDDASLEDQFASAPVPNGKQCLTLTHASALVIQDPAVTHKDKSPLLFYSRPGNLPGSVLLWMSSRTRSLILRNDYGLPELDKAVVPLLDEQNSPQFHLMSREFEQVVHRGTMDKLLLVNPLVDVESCFGDPKGFCYDRDISEVTQYLRSVYSVKVQPGLKLSEWPKEALSWTSRKKHWPRGDLVKETLEQDVFVVPFCGGASCPSQEGGDPFCEPLDALWEYSFCLAEEFLLEHAGKEKLCILLEAQVLLYQISDPNLAWHRLLKQTFLWCLGKEENPTCNALLSLFEEFLEKRNLPLYFMDDVNTLKTIQDADIDEMHAAAKSVLTMSTEERAELLQNYTRAHQGCEQGPLCLHLKRSFDDLVQLLYLQLYHQLHCKNLDQAVQFHLLLLQIPESPLREPLTRLLANSLGCLLMVKAGHSASRSEKRHFARKAQEMLVDSINMDTLSGRVKLAGFHHFRGEHEEVIHLLQDFDAKIPAQFDGTSPESLEDFRDFLWATWKGSAYCFDLVYSEHEKGFLPSDLVSCFGLMLAQVLGYVTHPVALCDVRVAAAYLSLLSLIALKKVTHRSQCKQLLEVILAKAEESEEPDMNEKRNAVYVNLLASVHVALGEQEIAEGFLRRSVTLMSNPRNPARWTLFKMRTKRTRKMLTWGALTIGVSACVALALKTLRS